MSAMHTITSKRDALIALCKKYHVEKLEVFGSAASGRFQPSRSDYDFLVSFKPIPQARTFNCFFDFKDEVQRLFGARIDLLEEDAIRNPLLLQSIQQNPRELIYAAKGERQPA